MNSFADIFGQLLNCSFAFFIAAPPGLAYSLRPGSTVERVLTVAELHSYLDNRGLFDIKEGKSMKELATASYYSVRTLSRPNSLDPPHCGEASPRRGGSWLGRLAPP